MDFKRISKETRISNSVEENLLLALVKEICAEEDNKLSSKIKGKINRIIADCDLKHHISLHKVYTADDQNSTLLGLMNKTSTELTFEEQFEFNQAVIQKIETSVPKLMADYNGYCETRNKVLNDRKHSKEQYISELRKSIDKNCNDLHEQENKKVDLMTEWLNFRVNETSFGSDYTELLTLKTRALELKSKLLYLKFMQNIFTETNQSIKSYSEVRKDLLSSIKETEERINKYKEIIARDS